MHIDLILDNIYPMPDASKLKLKQNIIQVALPKGHILLSPDKVATDIYLIGKGIVRAYAETEENEVTFWFGREGDTIISMRSYVENKKSYESIELLEDCDLYRLRSETLQQLFVEDIHIANWGRRFAEKELIKTEEKLVSGQSGTASERYRALIKKDPELIQRVQLGHIASYLGITQVSLSRIRAEIK